MRPYLAIAGYFYTGFGSLNSCGHFVNAVSVECLEQNPNSKGLKKNREENTVSICRKLLKKKCKWEVKKWCGLGYECGVKSFF